MAKASDFKAESRWTLEAEIDLSAQGSGFVVTDLPTKILQFEFFNVRTSSGDDEIEAQISNDNGSSFWQGGQGNDEYRSRALIINSNTSKDRWQLTIGAKLEGVASNNYNPFQLNLTMYNFSVKGFPSAVGLYGKKSTSSGFLSLAQENGSFTPPMNAIKFMLITETFENGTLRIWSS